MIHARNARPHPTLETDHGDDWRDRARCVGVDPDIFTIPEGASWTSEWGQRHAELARSVCIGRACPVVSACLADAKALRDDWTFRGGMTPDERNATKKGPKPHAKCGRGHDISKEGSRYRNGKCRECALARSRVQREERKRDAS